MRQFETTKLFYDTYLYKVSITCPIAPIFREKQLSKARGVLDDFYTQLDNRGFITDQWGQRTKTISTSTLIHACHLYNEFSTQKQSSYKLRIESPTIIVYSNDLYWIEHLVSTVDHVTEIWKPADSSSVHLLEPNVIISNGPIEFEYKVTVGTDVDSSFAGWARKNPDKVKAGRVFLNLVEANNYVNGMYFYCRDMKILQFVNIIIGGAIRRVDKFINKSDIDK